MVTTVVIKAPTISSAELTCFNTLSSPGGQRAWSSVLQVRETGFGRVSGWLAGWFLVCW